MENDVSPKNILDRDRDISVGDIVTLDDNEPEVKAYVVKSIVDDIATLISIEVTEAHDDVYIKATLAPIDELLYLGDSFINVNGYLWKVRDSILKEAYRGMLDVSCIDAA